MLRCRCCTWSHPSAGWLQCPTFSCTLRLCSLAGESKACRWFGLHIALSGAAVVQHVWLAATVHLPCRRWQCSCCACSAARQHTSGAFPRSWLCSSGWQIFMNILGPTLCLHRQAPGDAAHGCPTVGSKHNGSASPSGPVVRQRLHSWAACCTMCVHAVLCQAMRRRDAAGPHCVLQWEAYLWRAMHQLLIN